MIMGSIIDDIEKCILEKVGGIDSLKHNLPLLIFKAMDEIIDNERTGRTLFSQTEKTEKTYLGTKLEIWIRSFFDVPKGTKHDLVIANTDVDVKTTIGTNWMIPSECIGSPCLLISINEPSNVVKLGLFLAQEEYLSTSHNRDKKRSLNKLGKDSIKWLIEERMPQRGSPAAKSIDDLIKIDAERQSIHNFF